MNSEMQRRLYEMEVTPPIAVWERLSLDIDEINEDNLIAIKILDAELTPPASAWEILSSNIDEINEDNRLASKVLNAELTPPPSVWEKIDSTINVAEEKPFQKKGTVINLRRLAAAAIFIGIIATAWIILRNNSGPKSLAETKKPTQQKTSADTNRSTKNENPDLIDNSIDRSTLTQSEAPKISQDKILASNEQPQQINKTNNLPKRRIDLTAQPATAEFASLNEPLNKNFNEPIDDLSLVTSDQNYLTMVNANGRLVKIPTQLASLAPHLQDKPVSEDIYEVIFGEGTYWKETLNEWRKKLISTPSSGDAFTSFVELLKTVQNK